MFYISSDLATELNEQASENPDLEFDQIPASAEETTVFIDKVVTVREVTTLDVKRVAGDTQVNIMLKMSFSAFLSSGRVGCGFLD